MKTSRFQGKTAFMAALFVASVFILGIKLLNPATIQVIIEGQSTVVEQIPGLFTYTDGVILVVVSVVFGVSGAYLLFFDSEARTEKSPLEPIGKLVLEDRKRRWEEIIRTLKDDEQVIYKAIIDSDGIINQSDLCKKTAISKSNVSRSLDLLESKGLIEKRRRGMGNIIMLK